MISFGSKNKTAGLMSAAALMLATAGASAIPAQTVRDTTVPETGLDIPANLQIFGKVDPNVRKPTAIVNNTVITGTDVDHRMALIALYNNVPVGRIPGEERDRLRLQILRQLIDETLQVQEAKTADITVTPAEVTQAFARTAQASFKTTADKLPAILAAAGSSDRSLKREIEAELAWQRYLRRRVEPFVNVGDQEVKGILDRLKAAQGTQEFNVKEIFLKADSANEQRVFGKAREIIADLAKGTQPFEVLANQYTETSLKGKGGDLGWVRGAVLPPELAQAASEMQIGQVAGPIPNSGGFSILYLTDKRQVLTADPRDAKLSLKQLTLRFPPNTTQADATARAAAFANGLRTLQGCGTADRVGAALGAEVVDNDSIQVRQLPAPLQEIILKLQIGQATPPFGSPVEGVRSLVLCGRDDVRGADLPRADQVQNQLEQTRVNLRAQQKLRDLRRDAVVDYR
ncbi:MAG: peptidylprolyl isomerase [Sphingomonas bacterium]|uniref:peptidylprolyl isomerase n=1 Tax=Sphingomonas bacterium TaxID=1895847 RepID=UPI002619EE64|nr:peptidylprolyl isomerase [Sphingomonas bacterium]MDB5695648.1 peptidylprolyl isomerase [Sphingomonas bacterium]